MNFWKAILSYILKKTILKTRNYIFYYAITELQIPTLFSVQFKRIFNLIKKILSNLCERNVRIIERSTVEEASQNFRQLMILYKSFRS